MSMFHVGQLVCCVDAKPRDYTPWASNPGALDGLTEGRVYTVRELKIVRAVLTVLLVEIVRPTLGPVGVEYGEVGYHPRRFRPAKLASKEVFEQLTAPFRKNVEPVSKDELTRIEARNGF
jgi:hypothetical protein